jgi:hypothetical protein
MIDTEKLGKDILMALATEANLDTAFQCAVWGAEWAEKEMNELI